jgi:SH3-like domain-containing protein
MRALTIGTAAPFAFACLGLAALMLAGCERGGEGKDCAAGARLSRVSGYCVPRYLSLKRGEVYARKGPGKDYPTLWVYRAKGLPVQVVAETTDWRRICDPDGGIAWVHRTMLDGRRTVIATAARAVPLRREPRADSPADGLLNARSLASFERDKGPWRRISAGGVAGWVTAEEVWGTALQAQCR